jgi:hypothetical protein
MDIRGQQSDPSSSLRARLEAAGADALRRGRERSQDAQRDLNGGNSRIQQARTEAARAKDARIDAADQKQARIDAARAQEARSKQADRLELSEGARALLAAESRPAERMSAEPGRLAELRQLIQDGGLFSPERIEDAARRLLSGE